MKTNVKTIMFTKKAYANCPPARLWSPVSVPCVLPPKLSNSGRPFRCRVQRPAGARAAPMSAAVARAEHLFGVIKRLRGYGNACYRGLPKIATCAVAILALVNIYISRQRLLAQVRP